jgi:hypothetical protein
MIYTGKYLMMPCINDWKMINAKSYSRISRPANGKWLILLPE